MKVTASTHVQRNLACQPSQKIRGAKPVKQPRFSGILSPNPSKKLTKLMLKDFWQQMQSGNLSWKVDRYENRGDRTIEPHNFMGELLVEPGQIKGIEKLGLPDAMFVDDQGQPKPVAVKFWVARNPSSFMVEFGSKTIAISRISKQPWTLFVKPNPDTMVEYGLNRMYKKLVTLAKAGKLGETREGLQSRERDEERIATLQATAQVIKQMASDFSVEEKTREKVAQSVQYDAYRLKPVQLEPKAAALFHLEAGKPLDAKLVSTGTSWELHIGGRKLYNQMSLKNSLMARLLPWSKPRPAEVEMSQLVQALMKSRVYKGR